MPTTTTTTTPTTTTTTTTTTTPVPPLYTVQTTLYELVNGNFQAIEISNASDSSQTKNTPIAHSLNFGTIAPNETSKTIIVALNIPYAKAIADIKLGLVSTGDITFADNLFGITTSVELREDIVPDVYFQGINSDNSASNIYNISIPNKDEHTSAYVYLNVKLPVGQIIGEGMPKFKWFFKFSG